MDIKLQNTPGSGDFIQDISALVSGIVGIKLGIEQRSMVKARIKRRISELQLTDVKEYWDYFHTNKEKETSALISLLTTHHTFFFRDYCHFEFLEKSGLKTLIQAAKKENRKTLRVWSAGCSTGQEVYSLSMLLAQHLPRIAPDFNYEILGTDIDSESIKIAQNGVYHRKEINEIPLHLMSGHWARGSGEIRDFVKAKSTIKSQCTFKVANLMNDPMLEGPFDLIFCRNVFIYFKSEDVEAVVKKLLRQLTKQGFLVTGLSESLMGAGLNLKGCGPSIYSRKEAETTPQPEIHLSSDIRRPLRVICVDDSPTVLSLLKRGLEYGGDFTIVGTASNGIEAARILKEIPTDLMTLDIHMPEQNGLEYLQKNMNPSHPPVVVISSVSRDDSELALKCLEAGASDYVEKPSISNLSQRSDEIKAKLFCAFSHGHPTSKSSLDLDRQFSNRFEVTRPHHKLMFMIGNLGNRNQFSTHLKELGSYPPPIVILIEGAEPTLQVFAQKLQKDCGLEVNSCESGTIALEPGKIYVGDFSKCFESMMNREKHRRTSFLVYGKISQMAAYAIAQWDNAQVIVEELGDDPLLRSGFPLEIATETVPLTSFLYLCNQFFSQDTE